MTNDALRTVGMITIGQTPRDDLLPQFQTLLGPGFRLREAGALDGLGVAEVHERLAPQPGQHPLITRMADGEVVVVAKEALVPRLQACMAALEAEVSLFCVLCTGAFPPFRTRRPVLEADRVLFGALQAVFPGGRLGVLLPLADQAETAAARWSAISTEPVLEAESPFGGAEELARVGERFRAAGVAMVVVDCMGFTLHQRDLLRRAAGVPVLMPSSLLARFIAELA